MEKKITHIINVTKNVKCFFDDNSNNDLKIKYFQVSIDDTHTEDIGKHFKDTHNFIGKRESKIITFIN